MRTTVAIAFTLFGCGHADKAAGVEDAAQTSIDARSSIADAPRPPIADATPAPRFLCSEAPPEGAPTPTPPPPPSGGACPALVAGLNTFTSSAVQRQFMIVLPANMLPTEQLPVLFLWYWLGGSAQGFIDEGEVQAAADDERFIAVVPLSGGADLLGTSWDLKWPFDITESTDRMNQEFTFFDDMLGCVEAQYNVNQNCVSTAGVSAGALFVDQLIQGRSERLSSFMSMSGGVNDVIIKPWVGATHKLPGLVLWGGDGPPTMDGNRDLLGCFGIGMDFSVATKDLETGLVADGHFFVECEHNCGHVEPPLDPVPGESKFAAIWGFALNHPYWLAPGQSPYLTTGLPTDMPAWCGLGPMSATPRSGGGCPVAENPCAF